MSAPPPPSSAGTGRPWIPNLAQARHASGENSPAASRSARSWSSSRRANSTAAALSSSLLGAQREVQLLPLPASRAPRPAALSFPAACPVDIRARVSIISPLREQPGSIVARLVELPGVNADTSDHPHKSRLSRPRPAMTRRRAKAQSRLWPAVLNTSRLPAACRVQKIFMRPDLPQRRARLATGQAAQSHSLICSAMTLACFSKVPDDHHAARSCSSSSITVSKDIAIRSSMPTCRNRIISLACHQLPSKNTVDTTRRRVATARRPWMTTTGGGKYRSGGTVITRVGDESGAA